MKIFINRKYTTIAFYATVVIAINVLLVVAITKFGSIMKILSSLLNVLTPIIWGLVIAFLVNPIMVKTESLVKKIANRNEKKRKIRKNGLRAFSVIISSLVFLGIVIGLVSIVVPEIISSLIDIFNNAGEIADKVQEWINKLLKNYPALKENATEKLKSFTTDIGMIIEKIQPMLENILSGAWGVVTFLKNFVLGFIVSVYMLVSKEKLLAQIKKSLIAITTKSTCSKVMNVCSRANKVFSGFITGKIIDSIIIGMLCFIGVTIMDMPYSIMVSVLVGITNIIPFFGPIIGAIPSVFLILLVDPKKAILLAVFIVILQQFDGNILGPKILGDSTGLPGFWVLVSLLVFGGLFGFVGMVIAVPVTALVYSFARDSVTEKLRKKKLPVETEYYAKDVAHIYDKEYRKPLTPEQLEKITIPSAESVNEALDDSDKDK